MKGFRHWLWKKCLHWDLDDMSHLETLGFFAFSLQIPIVYSAARGRATNSTFICPIVLYCSIICRFKICHIWLWGKKHKITHGMESNCMHKLFYHKKISSEVTLCFFFFFFLKFLQSPASAESLPCLHRLQEGLWQGMARSLMGNYEEIQHQC